MFITFGHFQNLIGRRDHIWRQVVQLIRKFRGILLDLNPPDILLMLKNLLQEKL